MFARMQVVIYDRHLEIANSVTSHVYHARFCPCVWWTIQHV